MTEITEFLEVFLRRENYRILAFGLESDFFQIFFNFAIVASDYRIIVFNNKILKIQALSTDRSIDPSVHILITGRKRILKGLKC